MADKEASLLLKIKTAGEEALSKVGSLLSDIGKIGVGIFAAVTAAVVKSIDAYKEQEEATKSLTQAMINNGVYSKKQLDDYAAQATALQKLTTYADENIMAAQAAVQQQIGAHTVTKDLTKAILDFATAQKMDLVSAAELVGKSIGTSNNALGRYGIEISTAGSQSEKTAQVIEGLNAKFGGQAEAAAQGLGSIDQLKNAVGDLFEVLGEKLAPVVTLISQGLTKLASDSSNTGSYIDDLIITFNTLTNVAAHVINAFRAVGDTIGISLGVAVEAATAAVELNFTKMKSVISQGGEALNQAAIQRENDLNAQLTAIDKAFTDQREAKDAEELVKLETTLQRKGEVQLREQQNQKILSLTNEQTFFESKMAQSEANHQLEMAKLLTDEDSKNIAILAANEAKLKADIQYTDKKIALATSTNQKLKLLQEKSNLESALSGMDAAKKEIEREKAKNDMIEMNRKDSLSRIAGMQGSSNYALASIGKAAALTQLAIDTPMAIGRALAAAPPPFNFVLAAGVAAAMAEQVSRVSGIALAEGGIVKARPGGIQATIGEGGQDEAVIPLDKAGMIGGGNVTINVYGGLLGDQSSAHEFAVAVDKELFKLRRNNESTAFDGRI